MSEPFTPSKVPLPSPKILEVVNNSRFGPPWHEPPPGSPDAFNAPRDYLYEFDSVSGVSSNDPYFDVLYSDLVGWGGGPPANVMCILQFKADYYPWELGGGSWLSGRWSASQGYEVTDMVDPLATLDNFIYVDPIDSKFYKYEQISGVTTPYSQSVIFENPGADRQRVRFSHTGNARKWYSNEGTKYVLLGTEDFVSTECIIPNPNALTLESQNIVMRNAFSTSAGVQRLHITIKFDNAGVSRTDNWAD